MGVITFKHFIEDYSAKEAFNRLVADALYEKGHDRYNGTISTCDLGRCTLKFDEYSPTNKEKIYKHLYDRDGGEKWVADYVDLGPIEYHVLTVKKRPVSKEAPKYKIKFSVKRATWIDGRRREFLTVKSFKTKTEADQFALEQTLKTLEEHQVIKEYVLEKGNDCLTETYIEKKVYKSKPTLKPMPNRKVVALHKYLFYGQASWKQDF